MNAGSTERVLIYLLASIDQVLAQLEVSDEIQENWAIDKANVEGWLSRRQSPGPADFAAMRSRRKANIEEIREAVEAKEEQRPLPPAGGPDTLARPASFDSRPTTPPPVVPEPEETTLGD